MAKFRYTGIDKQGRRIQGIIDDTSEERIIAQLEKLGIEIISIRPDKPSLFFSFTKSAVTRKQLITFTAQMQQLLAAGVPLLNVLQALYEAFEEPEMKELLGALTRDIQSGQTFSDAIGAHPGIFNQVYHAMIHVGERTGQLDQVLKELEEMLKWEDELAAKAKKITIYPAIVSVVVLAVTLVMMLFVVPQLIQFIQQMGGDLGIATTSLIATSNFVQSNILLILITPFVLILLLRYLRRKSPSFHYRTDCLLLKLPLIGKIMHRIKLARMSSVLAALYSAGIPFSNGLKTARNVVSNRCIEARIDMAQQQIEAGELIHAAFRVSQLMPVLATYMLKAGEETGQLDESLRNIRYFYDREAKEMIEKIEPAIEPLLTLILAGIVLWLMAATLMPIYDTLSNLDI